MLTCCPSASYLRQTILLSPFEVSESRALFNHNLHNVAGKIRSHRRWRPVKVPEGVEQVRLHDKSTPDATNPRHPTRHSSSSIASALKTNRTSDLNISQLRCSRPSSSLPFRASILPSSYRPLLISFASRIGSEASMESPSVCYPSRCSSFSSVCRVTYLCRRYSSNQDISRARQSFFTGKRSFLLISERFHFYRRYNGPPSWLLRPINSRHIPDTKSEGFATSFSMAFPNILSFILSSCRIRSWTTMLWRRILPAALFIRTTIGLS